MCIFISTAQLQVLHRLHINQEKKHWTSTWRDLFLWCYQKNFHLFHLKIVAFSRIKITQIIAVIIPKKKQRFSEVSNMAFILLGVSKKTFAIKLNISKRSSFELNCTLSKMGEIIIQFKNLLEPSLKFYSSSSQKGEHTI